MAAKRKHPADTKCTIKGCGCITTYFSMPAHFRRYHPGFRMKDNIARLSKAARKAKIKLQRKQGKHPLMTPTFVDVSLIPVIVGQPVVISNNISEK
jgi:hypothetical protein